MSVQLSTWQIILIGLALCIVFALVAGVNVRIVDRDWIWVRQRGNDNRNFLERLKDLEKADLEDRETETDDRPWRPFRPFRPFRSTSSTEQV